MQGGEYPDVIHLATGREAALTEQFIKGHMITDITDVLSPNSHISSHVFGTSHPFSSKRPAL